MPKPLTREKAGMDSFVERLAELAEEYKAKTDIKGKVNTKTKIKFV